MKTIDILKNYRQKKLQKFYSYLETNGDIMLSCRLTGIDYFILRNWIKIEPELKQRIQALSKLSADEGARLFDTRLNGRDVKKTPEIIAIILEAIAHGIGVVKACEGVAGVNYQTFHGWCQEDLDLQKKVDNLKSGIIRKVENAWMQKLLEGKGSPIDYIFFLTNKLPEEYKNKQEIDHNVSENLVEKFKGKSVEELQNYAHDLIGKNRISKN